MFTEVRERSLFLLKNEEKGLNLGRATYGKEQALGTKINDAFDFNL